VDSGIEYINAGLYAFDLLKSCRVPEYEIMDTSCILAMEERLKCPRTLWPTLRSDDPVALYLGFRPGACLQIRSGFYEQNLRHVTNG
jgi:DNA-directed RNA polymerase subunit H (RpoH/RPB5)